MKTKANTILTEMYARAGQRMMEKYNQDYFDWLDEEEQEIACKAERDLGLEICLCGKHDDPDFKSI